MKVRSEPVKITIGRAGSCWQLRSIGLRRIAQTKTPPIARRRFHEGVLPVPSGQETKSP